MTDSVLPPWTPVRAEKREANRAVHIGVWGRTYEFAGSVFPSKINILGRQILAGSVSMHAEVDGRHAAWEREVEPQIAEADSGRVRLQWDTEAENVTLEGTATVEYDGMVRFDIVLRPSRPVQIEDLRFEIPIKSEYASLRTYWPIQHRTTINSGEVPEGGMFLPFKAFVWLGNEDLGLAWFSESDADWFPRYPRRAIEIQKQKGETKLILHLVDRPMVLNPKAEPTSGTIPRLSYTFGIQATPVKPWPSDFHSWHLDHGVGYGWEEREPGQRMSKLEIAAERGVKTLVFHESWTEIQNYSSTARGEDLKRLVSATHELGMKILLYFGYEMSTIAPEWDEFSKLFLVRPRAGGYTRLPEQTAYVVCYRSRWANFLVEGIQEVMKRYGVDGVYLDTTTLPSACVNTDHGCGYRSHDGRIKPTHPIFAVRDMLKRIYAVVRAKAGGMVNTHQYSCVLTPTLSWSTSYWDGEQIARMTPEGKPPLELVSLEGYRAEFMGRNHGMPAEFLVYVPGHTLSTRQALALSLIHDVPVRPGGVGSMLRQISKIWSVWDDFEVDNAEWFPYWSNSEFVSTNPPDIMVSFHRHPRHGLLFVISNLGNEESLVEVRIDVEQLGITGRNVNAFDAETNEHVEFHEGTVAVEVPATDYRLVRVRAR